MIREKIKSLATIALLASSSCILAQSWFTPEVEQRAEELLKNMTVREKLIYIGGEDWMYTKGFPRLGITRAKMSDGPQGLGTDGPSTAYPCMVMLASTFNRALAYEYGVAMSDDADARGVNIVLGPGMNITRAPFCGRNFEYMGEDPYLTSQTAGGYVTGLRENGVMAVPKHFTANYQDYDRNYVSSDIDERTLHEIYFPAFRHVLQVAESGAIMSSYNLLNGVWTTEDPTLLKDVLRKKWGFNGLVMSDWGSTHNCVPAVKSGLDLEMAGNEIENEDALRAHLAAGDITMADIDLKVKHILQTLIGFGFFDKAQWDGTLPSEDIASSKETALNVARDGVVLLKNEENVLPLSVEKTPKIAVVGNNALIYAAGGGSGLVTPFQYTSYYDGLKALGEQKGFEVTYVDQYDHLEGVLFTAPGSDTPGLKGEYYSNQHLDGTPVATQNDTRIGYEWTMGCGVTGIPKNYFSVRWTGVVRPTVSGTYTFKLSGDDGFRFYFNGDLKIDEWTPASVRERTFQTTLEAGEEYSIQIDYFQEGGAGSVDFSWERQGDEGQFADKLNAADVVVAFIGHNTASEGEGSDRSGDLPTAAKNIINAVFASTQKPVITVVNGGGNVYMWDNGNVGEKTKGLLWGWYGGQEAGQAMAEILLGDVNPSGKLPVTFEKKWEDNPVHDSYYYSGYPGPSGLHDSKHVKFTEGIFVGYRGYDKNNTDVQYPFGYGLSYTTFKLSDMQVANLQEGDSLVEVSFKIENTGERAGAEVVQLYVGKQGASPVPRAVRELKNYEKIYLEPGEAKTVSMKLSKNAFSYYDVTDGIKDFVVDNGTYKLELGVSSRDIKLSDEVIIDYRTGIPAVEGIKKNNYLYPTIVKAGDEISIRLGVADAVQVFDLGGQLVAEHAETDVLPTQTLQRGVYLVRYVVNATPYAEKIVIQ